MPSRLREVKRITVCPPSHRLANRAVRRLSGLRGRDRFAAGLEHGVALVDLCRVVCGVLPLEPDDLAAAGVVVQSDPGRECAHQAKPTSGRRCIRWPRAVVEQFSEGLGRCRVVWTSIRTTGPSRNVMVTSLPT